jgi:hypothetical protein
MRPCCPPGRGCNAPLHDERCVLELCREILPEEPTAMLALARWRAWQDTPAGHVARGERRFRRRAYLRARDEAIVVLAMHARSVGSPAAVGAPSRPTAAQCRCAPARRPTTRLGVLLGQHERSLRFDVGPWGPRA